jgi:hypothetical protein
VLFLTARIAPVKLVRVGEGGYVFLAHRSGFLLEVRVVNSIDGVDALSPIEHQQFAEEIKSLRAELAEFGGELACVGRESSHRFCAG